jgi:hypothetical protein
LVKIKRSSFFLTYSNATEEDRKRASYALSLELRKWNHEEAELEKLSL